ncbi:3-oxo-tetronate kinase [Mycobacterium sp. NPDC003449]
MSGIGVIADDFTGATDIAAAYVRRGYRAVVLIEDADPGDIADVDVVVVALKTRTAPVADAVARATAAHDRMRAIGVERFYVKYCSTFDSTDRGNIGPVLDALTERTGADHVVVVPSFPDNGRVVVDGLLYVNGELLEDSPMRHHPLTPMTRSRVRDLLAPQTIREVGELPLATVRSGADRLAAAIDSAAGAYLVVDAETDADLAAIAAATSRGPLVSGGAGLALGAPQGDAAETRMEYPRGRRLVVCGSASARTREQIAAAGSAGLSMRHLDIARLIADPEGVIAETLGWLAALGPGDTPVVHSVADLADIADDPAAAAMVERVLAAIVRGAVDSGARRIIVAGGETSGAVVGALGIDRLRIGQAIAPGVSWATARTAPDGHHIAIALKSGNFGAPDMFVTAWGELR